MRFEMFTKHEVEIFALHINFFLSACMQHTDKNVPRKWFFGAFSWHFVLQDRWSFRGLCSLDPLGAYSTPETPCCSRQWPVVTAYRAFGRIPLSSMPSGQIWPTTLNFFKKTLSISDIFLCLYCSVWQCYSWSLLVLARQVKIVSCMFQLYVQA